MISFLNGYSHTLLSIDVFVCQFMVLATPSAMATAACRIAEPPSAEMTMLTLIHYRGEGSARRRAPPDDIDFVPLSSRAP